MSAPLRFGYVLPTREFAVLAEVRAAPVLQLADLAEAIGYDSVWVSDSPYGRPRLDGLVMMSALAGRLSRATIGSAILMAGLRNPLLLASMLASIELTAPGRVIGGFGAGLPGPATDAQYRALGVDPERKIGRLGDIAALCKALWSAEAPLEWASPFSRTSAPLSLEQLRPTTPAGPPLWLGGSSPAAQNAVARFFDGWMPYVQHADELAVGVRRVRERAERHGRDPAEIAVAFVPTLLVADSQASLDERFARYCRIYYGKSPSEVLRQRPGMFVGTAAHCRDWLAGFVEAGATDIVCRIGVLDHLDAELHTIADTVLKPLRERVP